MPQPKPNLLYSLDVRGKCKRSLWGSSKMTSHGHMGKWRCKKELNNNNTSTNNVRQKKELFGPPTKKSLYGMSHSLKPSVFKF